MGRKKKLEHFIENVTFPHLLQPDFTGIEHGFYLKGKWAKKFFRNKNPLVLELGCGRGEYTVGLAKKHPDKNFIGIDRKGARMWFGAKMSLEENLVNVGFIRTHVELIPRLFNSGELHEIWITFPDPQPKPKKTPRRLTSARFLEIYRSLLVPSGKVHLKTDSRSLFEFTLEQVKSLQLHLIFATDQLYTSGWEGEATEIQTHYELKFRQEGLPVHYLVFSV